MQTLRILTNFGSSGKIARNKLADLLVLLVTQSFHLYRFFQKYNFSEQFAKSRSINLTSYFNTLVFKFSGFKMDFGIVSKNFSADR